MVRITLTVALALGLLAAGPAAAQLAATHIEEGQVFYFGTKIEWSKVNLPRTLEMASVCPGTPPCGAVAIDGENQVQGWGVGGGFGFVLPPNKVDLGRNLRIEVSGGAFSADADRTDRFPGGGQTVVLPFEEDSPDYIFMIADPYEAKVSLDYDTWDVTLLVRTDFGDVEGVVISPFFGATYSREDRWDKLRIVSSTGEFRTGAIDQEMNTDYAGGVLGSTLSLPIGCGARIALTGRADLMGGDVEATTKQDAEFAIYRRKDKDFSFTARLGGSAGLNVPVGPLLLVAEGFGNWQSWAPQATYGSRTGAANGIGEFRLTSHTLWNWGGRARLEFVF